MEQIGLDLASVNLEEVERGEEGDEKELRRIKIAIKESGQSRCTRGLE